MNTRRALLLGSIAAGGLLVAFATAAVPLSFSRLGTHDEGQSERYVRIADREDGEGDRHHERKVEDDDRDAVRDHDGDDKYDDDDDEDDEGHGGRNGPAKAGSATPPDNGLIRKGSTPKVQMN